MAGRYEFYVRVARPISYISLALTGFFKKKMCGRFAGTKKSDRINKVTVGLGSTVYGPQLLKEEPLIHASFLIFTQAATKVKRSHFRNQTKPVDHS